MSATAQGLLGGGTAGADGALQTVTLDTALTSIWRHVSAALGLPDTLPTD
ncbi:hypothetical protein HEK616_27800 [Streptomyces nigrescens]|uniref:Uncharacterized protein n=1 Tax=Streptomyces nigrescens TaxID=1920 RepID=A0ABM7ZSD4_STRNI|nr:hypothetical protein [Streptomyces nigrescens]BDM69293.1 hypothetical protein HEK616_27800 [Streptomyces nigrescens]